MAVFNSRFLFARPSVLVLLALALLPFLGLVFFAQPAIDDFDNAATSARLGRWGAQWYWYTQWSGRFVVIGCSTLLNPLSYSPRLGTEPAVLWALRGLIGLLLLALAEATRQFFRALLAWLPAPTKPQPTASRAAPPHLAGPLTLAVLALACNALPEPFTLLYWYSGTVNYVLPLAGTVFFAAAALRALRLAPGAPGRRRWAGGAGLGLLAGIGGGEITLLSCLVVLAGLGCWLWSRGPGGPAPGAAATGATAVSADPLLVAAQPTQTSPPAAARRLWAGWALAGLLTAALMLGAPGNFRRAALTDAGPKTRKLLLLAPRTALAAGRVAARPPVSGAMLLLAGAVLFTGAGLTTGRAPRPGRATIGLVLGGYVLLNSLGMALLKLAFMGDRWVEAPPARVVNVLVVQLLISTLALAWWARPWLPAGPAWLPRVAPPALVALALLVGLTGQARRAWPELLLTAPAHARQMQARYARLAAAAARRAPEVVLPPLRLPTAQGLLVPIPGARQRADVNVALSEDSTRKNNRFLAHYFRVPRVRLDAAMNNEQ